MDIGRAIVGLPADAFSTQQSIPSEGFQKVTFVVVDADHVDVVDANEIVVAVVTDLWLPWFLPGGLTSRSPW